MYLSIYTQIQAVFKHASQHATKHTRNMHAWQADANHASCAQTTSGQNVLLSSQAEAQLILKKHWMGVVSSLSLLSLSPFSFPLLF